MRTTIQVQKSLKSELDELKASPRETYEDIIVRLISLLKQREIENIKLMSEGYEEMAEDSRKIVEEWNTTELKYD